MIELHHLGRLQSFKRSIATWKGWNLIEILKKFFIAGFALSAVSCQTTQQAREIKFVGFQEDASKGKSVGPIEGSDCVFHVAGYWLGAYPTLAKAVMNARKGKSSSISEVVGSDEGTGEVGVRYFNNMSVSNDGFNAGIIGKFCIKISAMGYK